MDSNRHEKRLLFIILAFIFAIGFLIRVYQLGSIPPGLYTDELVGILRAKIQLSGVHSVPFANISSHTLPATLYDSINGYFLSILIFGLGTFAARFPYVLYSALTVFPLYGFAAEITKSKRAGLLAALLWVISPAPFVTARVGNAVEIFPLFIFLVILFLIMRLLRSDNKMGYYLLIFTLISISLYIGSIATWDIIPILVVLVALLGNWLFSSYRLSKFHKALAILYLDVVIIGILIIIFDSALLFKTVLKPLAANQVIPSFFLFNRPFYQSVPDFFVRLFTFLSPGKMFLLTSPFNPIISIHYVLVPFMLPFLMFIFYPAVAFFIISIILKRNWRRYLFILILFLSGFVQPILNISNPVTYLEPAEALFAVPFSLIILSTALDRFIHAILKSNSDGSVALSKKGVGKAFSRFTERNRAKIKNTIILGFTVLMVFGGVSTGIFVHTYFTEYRNTLEDNSSSPFYTSYGLEQASNFIVSHNLTGDEIFFLPANGSGINFSNGSQFNYWVYYLHFPSEWFYLYSHGKISNVDVIQPGGLPSPTERYALVVSQNASYGQFLRSNGYGVKILYETERADGNIASIIYQITPIPATPLDQHMVFQSISPENNETLSNFSLPVNSFFSATLSFRVTKNITSIGDKGIFYSQGYGFTLGFGPAQNFPWLHLSNLTNVPFGNLYSRIATSNYSIPHSWWQFAARSPISQGSVYLLTETYSHGTVSFYLNGALIGQNYVSYPVVISGLNIHRAENVTVISANIFNVSLNKGEVWSLFEDGT